MARLLRRLTVFFLAILITGSAVAEGGLPALYLTAPRLNYFVTRRGSVKAVDLNGAVTESEATLKYRGSSSARYVGKRNYSLHLKLNDGQNKLSLFSLRKDDDYVLDGMLSDMARMRNRVALDIWDDVYFLPWAQGVSGAVKGVFVELWFNDIYKGIYCLNERLDRKQLALSKTGGRIYRTTNPETDGVNLMDFSERELAAPKGTDTEFYNAEITFSGSEGNPWDAFAALYSFASGADDETFAGGIFDYLDLDNCAEYYLYLTVLGATDNMNKNVVLVCHDAAKDQKLYFVPWDMDASFGRRYNTVPVKSDVMRSNGLFDRLLALPQFRARVVERWEALKNTEYSLERLMARMTAYETLFMESKAYDREKERFPIFSDEVTGVECVLALPEEMEYIRRYMEERLAYLDSLFTPSFVNTLPVSSN